MEGYTSKLKSYLEVAQAFTGYTTNIISGDLSQTDINKDDYPFWLF